ncbi:MAG: Crp/Fnr family transcriptional regulator [Burkholderiales bacterium]|nr:Crp/Fnr family transcriptional regulator [Burkholderiales bacterium]
MLGAKRAETRITVANSLFAALPSSDYLRLLPALEPVMLTFGEVLCESGQPIRQVYFPNDALVSLLAPVDGHQALEVGLVGSEGMVGIPLALGISITPVRALVLGSGTAMRMETACFRREFSRSVPLQRELHRYTHALMTEVTQTAACNRFHMVEARLARRLLMTRDRLQSDHFRITQEFLAHMLGVRRVGITKAAHALKKRKLIDYSRGNIVILNGRGLEAASCSCYELVRKQLDGV